MEQISSYAERNGITLPPCVLSEPKSAMRHIAQELIERCGLKPWQKGTLASRRDISWAAKAKGMLEKRLSAIPELRHINIVGFYRVCTNNNRPAWWATKVQAITPSGIFFLEVEIPHD